MIAGYYYEALTPMGIWAPVKSAGYPRVRSSEGGKVKIRNVHELNEELMGVSLKSLQKAFNQKEGKDEKADTE